VFGIYWHLPPDGKRLASASLDATAKVWDAVGGQELLSLGHGGNAAVLSVAYSPDGRRLASADGRGRLMIWDTSNGQTTLSIRLPMGLARFLAFSPDGHRLACGDSYGRARVLDARPVQ